MRFLKFNLFIYFIITTKLLAVVVAFDSMTINPDRACIDDHNIRPKIQSNYAILRTLVSSLAVKAPLNGGFYNTSSGTGSNRIYGLLQCRGDTSYSACTACAKSAAKTALESCTDSVEVVVWNPTCSIRYSYRNFFGFVDKNISSIASYNETAGVVDPVDNVTGAAGMNMMSGVVAARTPNQALMFYGADSGMKRGMAQCTRDLSRGDCKACLENQLDSFQDFVKDKREWGINGASCRMWYRDAQVYANASNSAQNYYPTCTQMLSIIILFLLSLLL